MEEIRLITVGGIQYLVDARLYTWEGTSINSASVSCSIVPVTALPVDGLTKITATWFQETIESFIENDDVFHRAFLSNILLIMSNGGIEPEMTKEAENLLAEWDAKVYIISSGHPVPPGPYIRFDAGISKVFRLYPDQYEAFVFGVVQTTTDETKYKTLPLTGIPVPSRLYSDPPTPAKPLSGIRVAIKDVINLHGVPTAASCKAYGSFYGPAASTASVVTKLIEAGAIIVGKVKTSQFASGENPADWVDVSCPWNPRGDGYQSTDCSSSGSAAAIAGYEWLDMALGTDTLGSIVGPAGVQGIYGLRPTVGSLSLDGVVPVTSQFDTVGFFARDIRKMRQFGTAWFGQNIEMPHRFPQRILFPQDFFALFSQSKLDLIKLFIKDLINVSGLDVKPLNLSAKWSKLRPKETAESLQDHVATTLATIQLYDCYHAHQRFRDGYKAKYGHAPYVNPMIRYKWNLGSKISLVDYNQALSERDTFRSFLRQNIIRDDTIILVPAAVAKLMYRDEYLGRPEDFGTTLQGFSYMNNALCSCLAGLPTLSFPVGQHTIESRVTKAWVSEPVGLGIVGPPGSEDQLMAFVEHILKGSGRPMATMVGSNAF